MRAGDRQHPLLAQHGLGQPLRPRGIRSSAVEDRFEQRISARDGIADDEHVGVPGDLVELRRLVALNQFDAECGKLFAHRRVDVGVATGHGVAGLSRDRSEAAHERAADAEDVQMHGRGSVYGAELEREGALVRRFERARVSFEVGHAGW